MLGVRKHWAPTSVSLQCDLFIKTILCWNSVNKKKIPNKFFKLFTGYGISTYCNQIKSGRFDCQTRNGKSARRKDNNTHRRSTVSGDRCTSFTNRWSCWDAHRNWGSFIRQQFAHYFIWSTNCFRGNARVPITSFSLLCIHAFPAHQSQSLVLAFSVLWVVFWLVLVLYFMRKNRTALLQTTPALGCVCTKYLYC